MVSSGVTRSAAAALRPIARAWAAWERFLFARVNPSPLALLRIVFGLYLVYYYLDQLEFLSLNFFPPAIARPRPAFSADGFNLFGVLSGSYPARVGAYALTIACALALALGLQTRLAALLGFLLNHAWSFVPAGRNSGDAAVSVACFLILLCALPGHAQRAWAYDARFLEPRAGERTIPAYPIRLFQVQLVLIYFFTGAHKLASRDWYQGEALFYVFQQRGWSRVDMTWVQDPVLVGLATYGTLLFELLLFPVLVWVRGLRPFVLVAGVLFHSTISLTMRVFVFGEIMPILYLAFVRPERLLGRVEARFAALRARKREPPTSANSE